MSPGSVNQKPAKLASLTLSALRPGGKSAQIQLIGVKIASCCFD